MIDHALFHCLMDSLSILSNSLLTIHSNYCTCMLLTKAYRFKKIKLFCFGQQNIFDSVLIVVICLTLANTVFAISVCRCTPYPFFCSFIYCSLSLPQH